MSTQAPRDSTTAHPEMPAYAAIDLLRMGIVWMQATSRDAPRFACRKMEELTPVIGKLATDLKVRLFRSGAYWSHAERAQAAALGAMQERLAIACCDVAESLARQAGMREPDTRVAIVHALLHLGESVKWALGVERRALREHGGLHRLMRIAMSRGIERSPVQVEIEGRLVCTTIEGLYLRALLLANVGARCDCHALEILDAWMGTWLPWLRGSTQPPAGACLRADLDSEEGLTHGRRVTPGLSIYLPRKRLDQERRKLIAQLHQGRIVPGEGIASGFPIEDHVAALDALRHALEACGREPIPRAARHACPGPVEVVVGLDDIIADQRGAPVQHRGARMVDQSETGFAIDIELENGAGIAVGELVCVRVPQGGPAVLGRVARLVTATASGHARLGVHRVASAESSLSMALADEQAHCDRRLLYCFDTAGGGERDALLMPEPGYDRMARIRLETQGRAFTLRLGAVRERGRGWVLSAFEVVQH